MIVNNRGVSPVVGVILMVAITVILASVVGAFVSGLGMFSDSAFAGLDVKGNNVLLVDEGNTDEVHVIGDGGMAYELEEVGSALMLPDGHHTVVGIIDGNEQVLQSFTVDEDDVTADGEHGLEFNATDNDRISPDDQYNLDPRDESFTIAMYVSHQEDEIGTVFLNGHTSESYGIAWWGDSFRVGLRDDEGNTARPIIPIDWDRYNYVHIALAFDAATDEGHVYINGEHEETFDYSHVDGSLAPDQGWNIGGPWRLGGTSSDSHAVWTGDDARFYDRPLPEGEVDSLADGEHITDGLIGHWPMNDGAGDATTNTVTETEVSFSSDPRWTTPLAPLSQPRQAQ